MLNLLSIVIGIVFILLLFSLLTTTIMEMLSGLLSLRGRNLINAIKTMLGDKETEVFTNHVYFSQLKEKANLLRTIRKSGLPPSYIRPGTFTAILMDMLQINSTGEVKAVLAQLPEGKMKEILSFLYRESHDDIGIFRMKVEEWFNEVMERASEWYVNNMRVWLIWIGFITAVIFNVDVLNIYQSLSTNATLREYLADAATEYVETQPAPVATDSVLVNADFYAAKARMDTLLNNNIAALRSPLGLGWDNVEWPAPEEKTNWWLLKLIGWLTTALAVSLGAKFWFDLLRQLVSFRKGSSGETQQAVVVAPAPTPAPVLTRPDTGLFESTRRTGKEPEESEEDDGAKG
ncbi:MAG: hypothetical protein EP344_17655 [Bacteroidetes bacterium]|nr:MAG: hypothetical protein EP344_17655 [Bacteroidota bacterium]